MADEPDISIDGTVERVAFHNPDSSYTVAKVSTKEGEVTIVGRLMGVDEGMPLRLSGKWEVDKKYGRQFKVVDYELLTPKTKGGIEKFLGSKAFSGIGPSLAKRIVEKFGTDTLDVIEKTPNRLTEVIGIGAQRANLVAKVFGDQRQVQDVMVFLYGVGVSGAYAQRIFKRYGRDSVRVVKQNPYRLAHEVWGIGFRTADMIAEKLGIARDAPERLEAGLLHALETSVEDGNVQFPDEELMKSAADLLGCAVDQLPPRLAGLEASGLIVREVLGDRGACSALPEYHDAEVACADKVVQLLGAQGRPLAVDVTAAIHAFEALTTLELAEQQRRAVEAALRDSVTVITGGPGVGKTTIVKAIVHIARVGSRKVALAAPTGRAAKRLAEATGVEAMTIHRLLEYNPQEGGFQKNAEDPLDTNVLVIDEASMVDIMLFRAVTAALRPGSQLVLVGDVDQLPSVGAGAVLNDVIHSDAATVIRLTEIFRQAAQSKIVVSAHAINHGQLPDLEPPGPTTDFYFIGRDDPDAARNTIIELVAERIPARFGLDPLTQIQVLTPMHRGDLGTHVINRSLQERLNPPGIGEEIVRGERAFRRTDKVMQLKNDYDRNVFNGDIGVIASVDANGGVVQVEFDGKLVVYERAELDQLVHAYAVSVHKSQGSEYPAVVIPIVTQHFVMLQRSLLYTAVTRGKKLVVLVGSRRAVQLAVDNADARKRYTWLAERIRARVPA